MEYVTLTLKRSDLSPSPFEQLQRWYDEAEGLLEPGAMQLATYNNGRPSLRTVLLKSFDEKGLVFFTSYESRKAHELEKNPHTALLFLWKEQERQVTVEGKAKKLPLEEVQNYFDSRPRTSQIAAHASPQGRAIASREELEKRFEALTREYEGKTIPLPRLWGGFRVVPDRFEFWQGRPFRLHDRFQYSLKDGEWLIERLCP